MLHIIKCCDDGKPIHLIDLPNDWSPHQLITYYIEQYNILEAAKDQKEEILRTWLVSAKSRSTQDFVTKAEIKLLEGLIND